MHCNNRHDTIRKQTIKDEKLVRETSGRFSVSGAYYDAKKKRVIRYAPPTGMKKFAKKVATRLARHVSIEETMNGGGYRRPVSVAYIVT